MTSLKFAAIIGDIDDNYTESAVKKTVGLRTKRILAAAACFLAAGLVAFGLIQANVFKHEKKLDMTVSIPEDAVLPPAIENTSGVGYASYGAAYSVEKAFRMADAVCLLTVKNFITEDFCCSYFEASVDRVYKGELPESIVLSQFATSQFTLENSPRYTYGDKLLLFLVPSERKTIPGAYSSVGADISFFYAAPSSDGEIYLFDHKGLFSYNTYSCKDDEHPFNVRNRSSIQLVSDFCNYYSAFDKPIADRLNEYYEACVGHETASFALHIYSLEDMEEYFSYYYSYVDSDKLKAEFGASEETLALPTYELLDEFIRSHCFFSAATSFSWEFHRDHLDSYFRAYDAFRELVSREDLIPALDKYASEHEKSGNDPDRMLFLFMIKQSDIKNAISEVPDLSNRFPALYRVCPDRGSAD